MEFRRSGQREGRKKVKTWQKGKNSWHERVNNWARHMTATKSTSRYHGRVSAMDRVEVVRARASKSRPSLPGDDDDDADAVEEEGEDESEGRASRGFCESPSSPTALCCCCWCCWSFAVAAFTDATSVVEPEPSMMSSVLSSGMAACPWFNVLLTWACLMPEV